MEADVINETSPLDCVIPSSARKFLKYIYQTSLDNSSYQLSSSQQIVSLASPQ